MHYQYNYSKLHPLAAYDSTQRERKAKTIIAILQEIYTDTNKLKLLDVGASAGAIDNYLSNYLGEVTGIDIDEQAIEYAKINHQKSNLNFEIGDAMHLKFEESSFDIVICTQIYEHVPDPMLMMNEIYRVLKKGGVCYFAAGNRLVFNEPHYRLPMLSIMPKKLAHIYLQLMRRGETYFETHFTYWGLKKLVLNFQIRDFTVPMINNPSKYFIDYMLPPCSQKHRLAKFIARYFYWLLPTYIWILKKD